SEEHTSELQSQSNLVCRLLLEKKIDSATFQADLKTQSAVLHQLLILGEAAKRLSPEFRDAHAEFPWPLITGMRDKLIHHYDAVDLGVVWDTIEKDLPDFLVFITPLLFF